EDVVAADVNEADICVPTGKSQFADAPGIDPEPRVRLYLRLVNKVVRGAVDEHVGARGREKRRDAGGTVQVDVGPGERHDVAGQSRTQITTQLASGPEDGDLHGAFFAMNVVSDVSSSVFWSCCSDTFVSAVPIVTSRSPVMMTLIF